MSAVVLRASSQSGTLGFESLQKGCSMRCISSGLSKGLAEESPLSRQAFGFGKVSAVAGDNTCVMKKRRTA